MQRETLINEMVKTVKGEFAAEGENMAHAEFAYELGVQYGKTKRFDNSRYYHNYQYLLDDGDSVSATSFYNLFMNRHQTGAYMEAEQAVKTVLGDELGKADADRLFHLVRDQRFGINGAFKATMMPAESQQLSYTDFVMVIACFCLGVVKSMSDSL